MRIVLFCENKYAIDILNPIQEHVTKQHLPHEILWYIHKPKIDSFPYADQVKWTNSIQEVYDFQPEAIYVPGNIVPYYLPGVKIQVFHGYAAERKITGLSAVTLTPISPKVLTSLLTSRLWPRDMEISRCWKRDGLSRIGSRKTCINMMPTERNCSGKAARRP